MIQKTTFILLIITCFTNNNFAYQDNNNLKVDSLFSKHFASLDTNITSSKHQLVPADDFVFVYILAYMSGEKILTHSYSGHPMLTKEELQTLKRWYKCNQEKIKWENVEKGMNILKKPLSNDDHDFLKSLKIE